CPTRPFSRSLKRQSLVVPTGEDLRFGRVLLQRFPLAHEVADLPHERLVAIDGGLRRLAVVVEPGRGHGLLELLDLGLARGDARLEIGNALLQRFGRALLLAPLGLCRLPLLSFGLWLLVLR